MRVILVTVGTDGDVQPYLRLGRRLRARGHEVTLTSNAGHAGLASRDGFAFHPLVTEIETNRRLDDPDFWHPVKGPLLASEWGMNFIPEQLALLRRLAAAEDSLLVASPLILAARLTAELLQRPLAGVVLQPWAIPSATDPPVMPYGFSLPRRAPRLVGKLYWGLIHSIVQMRCGPRVNRLRRTLGLDSVRNVARWSFSPELVIGMFPPWYAAPQPDWPAQIRLAGFPLETAGEGEGLPRDLVDFCSTAPPPFVFTFGTGMRHAGRHLATAIDVCRRLGRRGILLTRHARQVPASLPPTVRHYPYAPFRELFPRCAAVVHHGGMGTLSNALAAGIPQLVLPLAHDQPDNAARIRRLGVGRSLHPLSGAQRISRGLSRLLTPEVRSRCSALARRLDVDDPFETMVDWIEELGARARRERASP